MASAVAIIAAGTFALISIGPTHVAHYQNIDIEVIGSDFVFYFRYPGPDRILFNHDDRYGSGTLYAPAGANVHLKLTSRDYVYTFEIPAHGVYEMAAPDLVFETRLSGSPPGTADLLGSQMCGYEHDGLLGAIRIETVADFERTMHSLPHQPPALP